MQSHKSDDLDDTKPVRMENIRRKFEGMMGTDRNKGNEKSPKRSTPKRFSKGAPLDLPFLLGNKDEEKTRAKQSSKKSSSSGPGSLEDIAASNELQQQMSSTQEPGSNVLGNIRKYMNNITSPRKSKGSVEAGDSILRHSRGKSLLQLEEMSPDHESGTFHVRYDNDALTGDIEAISVRNSLNEADSPTHLKRSIATVPTATAGGNLGDVNSLQQIDDETNNSSRNVSLDDSLQPGESATALPISPQPAPRLKINRSENSTAAPKPIPRKRSPFKTDTVPKDEETSQVNKDAGRSTNVSPGKDQGNEEIVVLINPKSQIRKKKSFKSISPFKSPVKLKRVSQHLDEGLLNILNQEDVRRTSVPELSEAEVKEREEKKEKERKRREEDERKQEEQAEAVRAMLEAEQQDEMKKPEEEEVSHIQLDIECAFVATGDKSPFRNDRDAFTMKSPKKVFKEVKRKMSTRLKTRPTRSPVSTTNDSKEENPRRPKSDVTGVEGPEKRRKSSTNNKGTLSRVKRAVSLRVASPRKKKQDRSSGAFDFSEGESWHVAEGALLNLDTRRTRRTKNDSVASPNMLSPMKRKYSRTLPRLPKRTDTVRPKSEDRSIGDAWNPVLGTFAMKRRNRDRVTRTLGYRDSFGRDDWDKITDFGGMGDRRAFSTNDQLDSNLYETIEDLSTRPLSWDCAFQQPHAPPYDPRPLTQSPLDGMQEYQFIDEVFAEINREAEMCDFGDSNSEADGDPRRSIYSSVDESSVAHESSIDEFDSISIVTVHENDSGAGSSADAGILDDPRRDSGAFSSCASSTSNSELATPPSVVSKKGKIYDSKQWMKSSELMKRIFPTQMASPASRDQQYAVTQKGDVLASTDVRDVTSHDDNNNKEGDVIIEVSKTPEHAGNQQKTPKKFGGLLGKLRISPKSIRHGRKSSEKAKAKYDGSTSKESPVLEKKKKKKKKSKNADLKGEGKFLEVPNAAGTFSNEENSFSDDSVYDVPPPSVTSSPSDIMSGLDDRQDAESDKPVGIETGGEEAEEKAPRMDLMSELGNVLRRNQPRSDSSGSDGLSRIRNGDVKGARITSDIVIYDIPISTPVEEEKDPIEEEKHLDTPRPSPVNLGSAVGERVKSMSFGQHALALKGNVFLQAMQNWSDVLLVQPVDNGEEEEADAIYDAPCNDESEAATPLGQEEGRRNIFSTDTVTQETLTVTSDAAGDAIYDETPGEVFVVPEEDDIYCEPPTEEKSAIGINETGLGENDEDEGIYDQPPGDSETSDFVTSSLTFKDKSPGNGEADSSRAYLSSFSSDDSEQIYDVTPDDLDAKEADEEQIYDEPPPSREGVDQEELIYDEPPSPDDVQVVVSKNQDAQHSNHKTEGRNSTPDHIVSTRSSVMYRKVEKSQIPAESSGIFDGGPDYQDIDDFASEEDDYVEMEKIRGDPGATPTRDHAFRSNSPYDTLQRTPTFEDDQGDFVQYFRVLQIEHGQCAMSTPYISVNRTPGRTLDQSGDIYASDCHGDCIDTYSYKGKHKSSISIPGCPRGLTSYTARHVLCAASASGEIHVIDTLRGAVVRKLGGAAKLRNPRCVVMHPRNQTFVTSDIQLLRKWRIAMFDVRTGNVVGSISSSHESKVGWPEFLTYKHGSEHEIYASDSQGHAVFGYDFRNPALPCLTIGGRGHDDGQFISPCGIEHLPGGQVTLSSPHGSLVVADWGNNRVSAFDDTTGQFQCHVIDEGSEPLRNPFDLKADTGGALYLSESGTNDIKVFHPL